MLVFVRRPPFIAPLRPSAAGRRGFTLVELLVAMTVLLIVLLMMVSMTSQTSQVWRKSRARIDTFQAARTAHERVARHLRQATLATYFDYYDNNGKSRTEALSANPAASFTPVTYDRASELQFVCGQAAALVPSSQNASARPTHALFFQAPLGYVSSPADAGSDFKGLNTVLNAVGYYIDFTSDSALRPPFMGTANPVWRYRLVELYQPSQNLNIYTSSAAATYSGTQSWFNLAVNPASPTVAPTVVTADNIVALVVRPEAAADAAAVSNPGSTTEIAPNYGYDTKAYLTGTDTYSQQAKNQLPPLVQVTLIALDADSAARLAGQFGASPPPLYAQSPFTDVTRYDADLSALENVLQGYHLNYRVFVADVGLPGAQWSPPVKH